MSDALKEITDLADRMREAERKVEQQEADLKVAKAELRNIAEVLLPDMMLEVGQSGFTTPSGLTVELKSQIHASPPKDRREEAWTWLDANGCGAIVKRKIVVTLGKDQEEAAKELQTQLAGKFADVTQSCSVHAQTLNLWARNRMKEGLAIDQKLFGIFKRNTVTIKEGRPLVFPDE